MSICPPLARPLALPECSQYGIGGIQTSKDVGQRHARLHRLAARGSVGLAGQTHQPAHALDNKVITSTVSVRPILPEAGNRAIDQIRLDNLQAGIVQPVSLESTGLEVFDKHIALAHQISDKLLAF